MNDDTATFKLSATMKMEDCEALHHFLTRNQGQEITIDCSAVDKLSGLAGQLLVMARKTWGQTETSMVLAQPSDGFKAGIVLLGLSDALTAHQVST